jgi:hypothetical protein
MIVQSPPTVSIDRSNNSSLHTRLTDADNDDEVDDDDDEDDGNHDDDDV